MAPTERIESAGFCPGRGFSQLPGLTVDVQSCAHEGGSSVAWSLVQLLDASYGADSGDTAKPGSARCCGRGRLGTDLGLSTE